MIPADMHAFYIRNEFYIPKEMINDKNLTSESLWKDIIFMSRERYDFKIINEIPRLNLTNKTITRSFNLCETKRQLNQKRDSEYNNKTNVLVT